MDVVEYKDNGRIVELEKMNTNGNGTSSSRPRWLQFCRRTHAYPPSCCAQSILIAAKRLLAALGPLSFVIAPSMSSI